LSYEYIYQRDEQPFGKSWEEWAELWCKWLLSIPKKNNPAVDKTGKSCSVNQNDKNVWYLTGTFGSDAPVKRKCIIPAGKAIFLPILEKEDSLVEDTDLRTDSDLIKRCKDATDKVLNMEASIDGQWLENLKNYRVRSEVFDLTFPKYNIYNVPPGKTRSVCDGYWLFIKPLQIGKHYIYFKGENLLDQFMIAYMKKCEIYHSNLKNMYEKSTFALEVLYELIISDNIE
jgi:hypothetical protein